MALTTHCSGKFPLMISNKTLKRIIFKHCLVELWVGITIIRTVALVTLKVIVHDYTALSVILANTNCTDNIVIITEQ